MHFCAKSIKPASQIKSSLLINLKIIKSVKNTYKYIITKTQNSYKRKIRRKQETILQLDGPTK